MSCIAKSIVFTGEGGGICDISKTYFSYTNTCHESHQSREFETLYLYSYMNNVQTV